MPRISRFLAKPAAFALGLFAGILLPCLNAGEQQSTPPRKAMTWQDIISPSPIPNQSAMPKVLRIRQVATLWGEPVMNDDPQTVSGKIIGALFKKYADQRGVTVSDEELTDYMATLKASEENWAKQEAAEAEKLKQALANETLPENEREPARRRIEAAEYRAQRSLETDEAFQALVQEQIYRPVLQRYKIMQQLYRDYGGRVVFQQMGPEPLEAMHHYLKDEYAKGSFAFSDPQTETEFWAYFTTTYHFYIDDEAETERLMNTPWWLGSPSPEDGN